MRTARVNKTKLERAIDKSKAKGWEYQLKVFDRTMNRFDKLIVEIIE